MATKKYTEREIKDAINQKFGGVYEYAEKLGLTPANVYKKIKTQSKGFLRELEKDGIILNIGRDNIGGDMRHSHNRTYNENDFEEIDKLRKENNRLKDELIDAKNKIIELLKKNEGT